MKRVMFRLQFIFVAISFLFLSACDQLETPTSVATEFWAAIQERNMEKAKNLATWDTVDYLKYFTSEKIYPERFELGETKMSETSAEIVTTLYSNKQGQSSVKIPGKTLLVKTEQGWRIDVKKTLGSVVRQTVDNVFDQLNGIMRQGVKELDKALSESFKDIGKALEESANELKKELSKPPLSNPPQKKAPEQPLGRQI